MKKVALAALLSSVVSGAALAADVPATANMVFEGTVTSTLPGSSLKITGIGGGLLTNGKLTVQQDGKFTTEIPVDFEIRSTTDNQIAPGKNLKYTNVNVVANGTSVIGAVPTLRLGSNQELVENTDVSIVDGTDALHIANVNTIADFHGGNVTATVAVMVSEPPVGGDGSSI